jgi:hypothetical protein
MDVRTRKTDSPRALSSHYGDGLGGLGGKVWAHALIKRRQLQGVQSGCKKGSRRMAELRADALNMPGQIGGCDRTR